MNNSTINDRSAVSLWMQAIRPFSLTATLIPVIFGAMFTLAFYNGPVNWSLMILIALGTPFFQLSGNLLSEYFDFKHNVDRKDTFGSSRVLVDGLMQPKAVLMGGITSLLILLIFGIILTYYRGIDMLVIGLFGMLGSYFYSTLKYKALGDLHIFIFFGPLMIFGTFYALTGSYELVKEIAVVSIPIGFLVTAILHANNTRDIKHDGEANVKTFASVIGVNSSKLYYRFLLVGAYLAVGIFIAMKLLPIWSLLVLVSFPIAMKNLKLIGKADVENPKEIAMLDIMTAQLHMIFGLLLSISILIGYFVK